VHQTDVYLFDVKNNQQIREHVPAYRLEKTVFEEVMMRDSVMRTALLVLVMMTVGFFVAASSLAADRDQIGFYDQYIDNKIEQIELEAMRFSEDSPASQCAAELHRAKAEYYAIYKDDLIEQMAESEDIGMNTNTVDYFLAQSFSETNPRETFASCRIAGSVG
jgi:hypothetical protein